jgi:peptidoglycan-N-acetylglucosamine deacetylase
MADWLGDSAAVFTLTFDVDAESPILAMGGRYARHITTMSHQSYGPDVGVPRILAMLDELGVPATFFVPGWVAEQRPWLAPTIVDRGHEVAHHSYAHRPATQMTPEEQRADFERALEVFDRQGVEVRGHRAALWQATPLTLEMVSAHGMDYSSSLMGDDRPYAHRLAEEKSLVELPVHWSLDDWEQYAFLPEPHVGSLIESPKKVLEMWTAELEGMRAYNGLMNLCLHPFLSARPSRILAVRELITRALEAGDIEFATCGDLARRAHGDSGLTVRDVPRIEADPAVYPE